MHKKILLSAIPFALIHTFAFAAPCSFDANKNCLLQRDILNDKSSANLRYYAATNYDHTISGEINIYDATLVQPYQDATNANGQIKLLLNKNNSNDKYKYRTGEIMTRANLDQAPYNSPTKSLPWTTKEIKHGYLEVTVKMPKCETSDDGLCQRNINPIDYNKGLWPAIWMMPTKDTNWPTNGEIDIAEAYQLNTCFNVSTATLHFNGNSGACTGGDCRGAGFHLGYGNTPKYPLFNEFHKWGFEWQPDPNSTTGAVMISGYFDGVKVYGPTSSAALPADGPNALNRGFNDPAGGYYLIVNLAVGGPYAGAPNSHLQTASMYVQSIKAYSVDESVEPGKCLAPINVQSMVSADKKQVTLAWQDPSGSAEIKNYQINDWQNKVMWKGTSKSQHCFTDPTLPGTSGIFTYYLYANCDSSQSAAVKYNVNIP